MKQKMKLILTSTLRDLGFAYGVEVNTLCDVDRLMEVIRYDIEQDSYDDYLKQLANEEDYEYGYE